MSKIHLIVGDHTAVNLKEALAQDENIAGELLVLKDILHVGPIARYEGKTFSETRSDFWNEVSDNNKPELITVNDLERLMEASSRLSNDDTLQVWLWMAPCAADICAYYWLLHFLKKHIGRFFVININGLPFLDDNGKLFYPDSITWLPVKEIIKAQKLARAITPSEWETDGDEWAKLQAENAGIRVFKGGKKLSGAAIDVYDEQLLALCTTQNQKATRVVNNAMNKHKIPTGDTFLLWRLRKLAEEGRIEMKSGDVKLTVG